MNYQIKTAETAEDFAQIAALAAQVWHATYDPLIGPAQVDYMLEKFQSAPVLTRSVQEEGYAYAMTVQGDRLLGYCGVRPEAEGAVFLSKVYVDPVFQRQGIAKAMILHFASEYAAQGFSRMWLTVNRDNRNAIAAYQRLGFEISGTLVTDIGEGYVMDDYTMVLALPVRS